MQGNEEIIKQFELLHQKLDGIKKKCNELTRIENEAREQIVGTSLFRVQGNKSMEHCNIKCNQCGETITLKVCPGVEPKYKNTETIKPQYWEADETVQLTKLFEVEGWRDTEMLSDALMKSRAEIESKLLYECMVTQEELNEGILYDGRERRMKYVSSGLTVPNTEKIVKKPSKFKLFMNFIR